MKATLTFNLSEEREEFEAAVDGMKHKAALENVWDNVFRPARKHGYSGLHAERLNKLIETEAYADEIIDMLGDIYQETLKDE